MTTFLVTVGGFTVSVVLLCTATMFLKFFFFWLLEDIFAPYRVQDQLLDFRNETNSRLEALEKKRKVCK